MFMFEHVRRTCQPELATQLGGVLSSISMSVYTVNFRDILGDLINQCGLRMYT